jgi:CheY-like chemotaxis protein
LPALSCKRETGRKKRGAEKSNALVTCLGLQFRRNCVSCKGFRLETCNHSRKGRAFMARERKERASAGAKSADVESSAKGGTARQTAENAAARSSTRRVLLVDDDAEIIEAIRYALETKGYQILVARDGNQGLAMAEREDPDLVILDMMMPKRSGFLVLEKLRRTRPVPVRVIMITANEGSRHKAYAEMLGVDDYIRKPFAMDRLLESVQRLLA